MHIVTGYPDGIFAWAELQTPDRAASHAFYGRLFDWAIVQKSARAAAAYDVATIDGHKVVGFYSHGPEMAALPAFWLAYVKHHDVDALADRAIAAGGTVVRSAVDMGACGAGTDEGRMAVIMDPTGAIVGLLQPGNHIGAEVVNSPNSLVWTELQTTGSEAVRPFYMDVFGWTDYEAEDGYVTFITDGRAHSSSVAIKPNWGTAESNWLVYFLVDDVNSKAELATELGGAVTYGPFAPSDTVRAAILRDPQGAAFALIQYGGPADPPPSI